MSVLTQGIINNSDFVFQSQKQRDSRSSPITILGRGIPHSSVMNKQTPSPGAKMSPQGNLFSKYTYEIRVVNVATQSPVVFLETCNSVAITDVPGNKGAAPFVGFDKLRFILKNSIRSLFISVSVMCRSLPSPPTLMSTLTARSSTPPPSPLPLSPTFNSQLMRPKSPSPSPHPSQQLSLRMQAALLLQNRMSNTSPLNLISSVVGMFIRFQLVFHLHLSLYISLLRITGQQ